MQGIIIEKFSLASQTLQSFLVRNTGCFLTADITSGINESPFHCSSKVVVLYKYNSEVYNFMYITKWGKISNKTRINAKLFFG